MAKKSKKYQADSNSSQNCYQPLLWEKYPVSEDGLTTQQVKKRFHLKPSKEKQARANRFLELESVVFLYKGQNYWRIIRTA